MALKKFIISGFVNALVGTCITYILYLIGFNTNFSLLLGYIIASIFSYYSHSLYSFRTELKNRMPSKKEYIILLVIVAFFSRIFSYFLNLLSIPANLIVILGSFFIAIINFIGWKVLVRNKN